MELFGRWNSLVTFNISTYLTPSRVGTHPESPLSRVVGPLAKFGLFLFFFRLGWSWPRIRFVLGWPSKYVSGGASSNPPASGVMELWPLSPPARSIRCRFESMGFHPGGWAGNGSAQIYLDVWGRKSGWINGIGINGWFHLLINRVYWGYKVKTYWS